MKIGAHRVTKEGDDLFAVTYGPNPSPDEIRAIIEYTNAKSEGKPIFLMLDFTRTDTFSPESRKAVGEATKHVNFKAIGMYGASFQVRVMAKLVNIAIALFRNQPFPQEFFDTRAATLAWFEEVRHRDASGSA